MFTTNYLQSTIQYIVLIQEHASILNPFLNQFKEDYGVQLKVCDYKILKSNNTFIKTQADLIVVDSIPIDQDSSMFFEKLLQNTKRNCRIMYFSTKIQSNYYPPFEMDQFVTDNKIEKEEKSNPIKNLISLPTNTGYKIVHKDSIVLFKYNKSKTTSEKGRWEVLLDTNEVFKLKPNATSKDFMRFFSNKEFIAISPQNYLNIKFLDTIELKSRQCYLKPPFNNIELIVSRNCYIEMKELLDI